MMKSTGGHSVFSKRPLT
jgi:hypothetical protein